MGKESSENHRGFIKSDITGDTPFFISNIPGLIGNLKQSPLWKTGELNSMVLYKKPEKKIVLTALHKGTKVDSIQSGDSITFQVMEGKLEFRAARESVTLKKGHLLTLHEKISYSLKSREETVYLLTIASGAIPST